MVVCSAFGCTNRTEMKKPGVTFHRLPKNEERRSSWIRATRRENWIPSVTSALCSEHFLEKDIDRTSLTRVRIREDAIPSVFPRFPSYLKTVVKQRKPPAKRKLEELCDEEEISQMVHYCCVPYCNSGYKSVRGISFHEIPSDIEQRSKWLKAIPRENWCPNHSSNYSRVCSLHFLPSDFKSNLKRRVLMPKAVPSIFPSHPYIPGSSKKWKKSIIDEKNCKATEDTSTEVVEGIEMSMEENISVSKSIGLQGGTHILSNDVCEDQVTILIHYHTESFATAEYGTALDVICWLHQQKRLSRVYFTETHPSNQGNQLTANELVHEKIPATLICDSMVSALLLTKKIAAVVVGAHKVAANGDTASEIGTYNIALSAQYHSVPFYVASPSSTIDMTLENGSLIPVEERPLCEMSKIISERFATNGINCWNPAIDITPAELITGGFITEHGVLPASSLKKLFHSKSIS